MSQVKKYEKLFVFVFAHVKHAPYHVHLIFFMSVRSWEFFIICKGETITGEEDLNPVFFPYIIKKKKRKKRKRKENQMMPLYKAYYWANILMHK